MSEELRDEVEAINSIYGGGCLVPADEDSPSIYILQLPGDEASSLKLGFPESYPAVPLEVLGVLHSSGGRKGAGAKDLALFRKSVEGVFQEGLVCLFDAIEEYSRRYEEVVQEEAEPVQPQEDQDLPSRQSSPSPDPTTLSPPPWTLSQPLTENKSTFLAHVAPVSSPAQARQYVRQLLASDRRIRSAAHNITAWRIRGDEAAAAGNSYQDCDDDGETAAGGRLLHLMQVMEVWGAMVVVTRWYGGVKLGPRRFAVINTVARDGFVRAGMVSETGRKKGK